MVKLLPKSFWRIFFFILVSTCNCTKNQIYCLCIFSMILNKNSRITRMLSSCCFWIELLPKHLLYCHLFKSNIFFFVANSKRYPQNNLPFRNRWLAKLWFKKYEICKQQSDLLQFWLQTSCNLQLVLQTSNMERLW